MPTPPRPPAKIELRYAQVEELIAGLLDVHEDRDDALAARLRLFKLKGFPSKVELGARGHFKYNLDSLIELVLGFTLLDALIPQEAVPSLVTSNWKDLSEGFATAFRLIGAKGEVGSMVALERPIIAICTTGLNTFRQPKKEREGRGKRDDAVKLSLAVITAADLRRGLPAIADRPPHSPVIMIEIQEMATFIRTAVIGAGWGASAQLDDYVPSAE